MAKLKSREFFVPNGFQYSVPPLNWKSPPGISFNSCVQQVYALARANPGVDMPRTIPEIEHAVEQANVQRCLQNGWVDYVHLDPEETPPKWFPPQQASRFAGKLAVGAKTLVAWLGNGANPENKEEAARRASICATCPQNQPGELSSFFERATSELIRRQVEFARDCELTTPADSKLGVCAVCACPLKLKVHVPLETIHAKLSAATLSELPEICWMK